MDFSKYIDLLITSELHFARADMFQDPFECSFAVFQDERARKAFLNNADIKEKYKELHNLCKLFVYLNCWHINDVQSAALWKLYSENKYETIVIQSTFEKLKSEIVSSHSMICLSNVKYDPNHAGTPIPNNPTVRSFAGEEKIIYKRKSFEHEKELRAFIYNGEDEINAAESGYKVEQLKIQRPEYIRIKVTLSNLIEKIYVSPLANDLFVELVKKVSGDLRDRVLKSDLYELY